MIVLVRVRSAFLALFCVGIPLWVAGCAAAEICDHVKPAEGGLLEIRELPSRESQALAPDVSPSGRQLCRRDGTANAEGDWIRVDQGWIDGSQIVSSFPADRAKTIVGDLSGKVVRRLMAADLNTLAAYVHPVKGVRFSPYGFLARDTDLRFSRQEIRDGWADRRIRVWGAYDGTGRPIRLSFRAYFARFVRDVDFAGGTWSFAENKAPYGTTRDNSGEEYPNAITVQSVAHAAEGERVLRLLFEQYRGRWYLVHIVHDQWTI